MLNAHCLGADAAVNIERPHVLIGQGNELFSRTIDLGSQLIWIRVGSLPLKALTNFILCTIRVHVR